MSSYSLRLSRSSSDTVSLNVAIQSRVLVIRVCRYIGIDAKSRSVQPVLRCRIEYYSEHSPLILHICNTNILYATDLWLHTLLKYVPYRTLSISHHFTHRLTIRKTEWKYSRRYQIDELLMVLVVIPLMRLVRALMD